ncbi:BTAD domain-containing putative transcriptional regulator [Nocardia sp. NPDC059195]|uniref:BTAD domain-containing putative transcriptional regulator n=1 Tax=Nocardia sp. NPDC059195 TaxID=3346765 RepID=UPI0036C72F47
MDLARFEMLVDEGRMLLHSEDAESASDAFRAALALWRGSALADLAEKGLFWPEIEALTALRHDAMEDYFDAELHCGRSVTVATEARRALETNPHRERLCAQLMTALYRGGRQADALAVYREFRTRLNADLGLEPSAKLKELEHFVLVHDQALAVEDTGVTEPDTATVVPSSSAPGVVPADVLHATADRGPNRGRRVDSDAHVEPLIDRDRELDVLSNLLALVRHRGRAETVVVLGEPGIGKSRVIHEFETRVRSTPATPMIPIVRVASGTDGGVMDAMRTTILAMCDEEPGSRIESGLWSRIRAVAESNHDAEWMWIRLRLLTADSRDQDALCWRDIFPAWHRFLGLLGPARTIMLVVENLDRATTAVRQFVRSLNSRDHALPMMLVTSSRPEASTLRPVFDSSGRDVFTLSLEPISDSAVNRLLEQRLGRYGLSFDLVDMNSEQQRLAVDFCEQLLVHIGGNPMFAIEYSSMLLDVALASEGQVVSGNDESVDASFETLLPTVFKVLHDLVRGVSVDKRDTLSDMAVLGNTASLDAVAALGKRDVEAVRHELDELVRVGILAHGVRLSDGRPQYTFRHTLVRHFAYRENSVAERAAKHAASAAWLQTEASWDVEAIAEHRARSVSLSNTAGGDGGTAIDHARHYLIAASRTADTVAELSKTARHYLAAADSHTDSYPAHVDMLIRDWRHLLRKTRSAVDAPLTTASGSAVAR